MEFPPMPVLNSAMEMQDEVAGWRHALHEKPELMFDVEETAAFVAAKLAEFGCDVVESGIGRTGVVGLIHGRAGNGATIGLRADMDALPITETSGKPWASRHPGKMHACGHDGHTAMLLGAARQLCETRNFRGSVAVIFQPAEEGGGGGKVMVEDGLMERFSVSEVYGMHNLPGLPVGAFALRRGPIMASTDEFTITIRGKGSHAAMPHAAVDPVVTGAAMVSALQTIVSRGTDPLEAVVVSVTKFHAGEAYNVIPETAEIAGTVRTLKPAMRDMAERRIREIVAGVAAAHGAQADVDYDRNYPVTVNHDAQAERAATVARRVAGDAAVNTEMPPLMAGEDFSYMLEARPGALIFTGNGDTAGLHHPAYDFNDTAIPYGVTYWVTLAETLLA
jgi:amidohydrolase